MRTIDVSMGIRPGMPSFPGDPEVATVPVRRLERGDPYNLSTWSLGSHTGTHVDPPLHFVPGGATTDALPLDRLNGRCRVVEIPAGISSLGPAELRDVPAGTRRLLLRTSNSTRWAKADVFFPDYVALNAAGADHLVRAGVDLVGIDSLSIEADPSGKFPVHHALLGRGVLILEGLQMAAAPPGEYELRCLPLRLVGGDGGPCRAVLVAP